MQNHTNGNKKILIIIIAILSVLIVVSIIGIIVLMQKNKKDVKNPSEEIFSGNVSQKIEQMDEEDVAEPKETEVATVVEVTADELFEHYICNEVPADLNGKNVYLKDLIDEEMAINEYFIEDMKNGNENYDLANDFCIKYVKLECNQEIKLFLEIRISYAEGVLYRLASKDSQLVVEDSVLLSWSDYVGYYKGGIIEISHGQHLPAVTKYLNAAKELSVEDPEERMNSNTKALLVTIGPEGWYDDELIKTYEEMAEQVLTYDVDIDMNQISEILGIDLEKANVEATTLEVPELINVH